MTFQEIAGAAFGGAGDFVACGWGNGASSGNFFNRLAKTSVLICSDCCNRWAISFQVIDVWTGGGAGGAGGFSDLDSEGLAAGVWILVGWDMTGWGAGEVSGIFFHPSTMSAADKLMMKINNTMIIQKIAVTDSGWLEWLSAGVLGSGIAFLGIGKVLDMIAYHNLSGLNHNSPNSLDFHNNLLC